MHWPTYRESYVPALAAGARCFEFSQTALDRLGLPLWTVASVGADGALSDGFGYGPTLTLPRRRARGGKRSSGTTRANGSRRLRACAPPSTRCNARTDPPLTR